MPTAINQQTSFLSAPLGFSRFHPCGAVPAEVATGTAYHGSPPS